MKRLANKVALSLAEIQEWGWPPLNHSNQIILGEFDSNIDIPVKNSRKSKIHLNSFFPH